jgi:hypothetical protein
VSRGGDTVSAVYEDHAAVANEEQQKGAPSVTRSGLSVG